MMKYLNIEIILHAIKYLLFTIILIILCISLYIIIAIYNMHNHNNINLSQSILWRDNDGILLSQNDGYDYETIHLLSKKRYILDNAPFAICNNQLYYWSRDDNSICTISMYRRPQWIYFKNKIPDSWECHSIYIYKNGIILIFRNNDNLSKCFKYNIKSKRIYLIPEAVDIRTNCKSSIIAILNSKHQVDIVNGTKRQILYNHEFNIIHWDYDPIYATLCIADDHHIIIKGKNFNYNWTLPLLCWIRDIEIKSKYHQLWVSVGLPYSAQQLLLIYTYNGKFIGNRLIYTFPIRNPIMDVTPAINKLLSKYKDQTNQIYNK